MRNTVGQGSRAALVMTALAGPAMASEVYDTSTPYDGQDLTESPNRITVRFTEPVRFDEASLQTADGRPVEVSYGMPEDDTDEISIRVPEALPPGTYRLRWLVYVTAHRHADDGVVQFTVLQPRR